MKYLVFFLVLFASSFTYAGVVEVGGSFNYRQTSYGYDTATNTTSLTIYQSYTASLAYYFSEMSAIEFSYTSGLNNDIRPQYNADTFFQIYGADLVLTFGSRESSLRPYIKGGGGYQLKQTMYKQPGFSPIIDKLSGPSFSAGFGFKFGLTQNLSLKAGIEGWTTPLGKDTSGKEITSIDTAARVGLSWLF